MFRRQQVPFYPFASHDIPLLLTLPEHGIIKNHDSTTQLLDQFPLWKLVV
jgi:hypothetical protein